MNLRVSIGCYIFSMYFVFFARSFDLSRKYRQISSPKSRVDVYLVFNLYTKQNSYNPQTLQINSTESLRNSSFDSSKSTVFVTHGWTNHARILSVTSFLRSAYLRGAHSLNVIEVEWKPVNASYNNETVILAETIGIKVAQMINFLKTQVGLQLNSVTLVGYSLGAHIMAVAGRETNGEVKQIFGLDPALRGFEDPHCASRLSESRAKYVQVIHTNGGQLGVLETVGHADFYPNGGKKQPGCRVADFVGDHGSCSREQSLWFFAESLNSAVGFQSLRCKSGEIPFETACTGDIFLMGGRSNTNNAIGRFYLKTNDRPPYALKLQRYDNGTYVYCNKMNLSDGRC